MKGPDINRFFRSTTTQTCIATRSFLSLIVHVLIFRFFYLLGKTNSASPYRYGLVVGEKEGVRLGTTLKQKYMVCYRLNHTSNKCGWGKKSRTFDDVLQVRAKEKNSYTSLKTDIEAFAPVRFCISEG